MTKQDIHKEFREYSVAEFFKKNRQMLGYSGKIKSLTTTIHEYVTNALDASEEAGFLPDIYVELKRLGPDYYKLIIEDNGPGINKKILSKAFGSMLTGTKFHRFQQARGQQGIGAAGVIMFSQVTTGKPTKVISSQGDGKIYEVDLSIDVKSNSPNVENEKEYPGQMRGIRLESEFKDIKYQKGDYSVDEYLRRTALANPHAKITYIDPDNLTTIYDRAVEKLPKLPTATLPHPKGIKTDDLMGYASVTKARNIKSFLQNDFSRMSAQKVKEIEDHVTFDMNKRPQDIKWEEAEQIVKEVEKMTFIAPPTDVLIPIGEENLEKALLNVIKPEFKTVITRPPTVYRGGVPFIIEVALAYGGKAGKPMEQEGRTTIDGEQAMQMEVMRFSNRVPLLFDAGACAISKAVNGIDWKRYNIKEGEPVAVIVNFTSIYVPYTGAGKESISEDEDIIKEIRLTLMDAARKLGNYVSGQRRAYEKERKKKILEVYAKPVAEALASITGEDKNKVEAKLKKIIEEKYELMLEESADEEPAVKEESEEESEE